MKCNNCGAEIKEGEVFCTLCGAPVNKMGQAIPQQNNGSNNGFSYDKLFNGEQPNQVSDQNNNYQSNPNYGQSSDYTPAQSYQPNNSYAQNQNYNSNANYAQNQNYGQNYGQNGNYSPNQNYGQNYNLNNNYGQKAPKSSNKSDIIKIFICVIAVLIIIAIIVFIIKTILSFPNNEMKDNGGKEDTKVYAQNNDEVDDNMSSIDSGDEPQINDIGIIGGTSTNQNPSTSAYNVEFAGFKLHIPDNLIYDEDNTTSDPMLLIYDELETWQTINTIVLGNYEKVKQNRSMLPSALVENMGLGAGTASPATVETINGVEFIIIEYSIGGENALVTIAGLNSMNVAFSIVYNENNDFSREPLESLANIISTAEYVGNEEYIEFDDTEGMKEFIEKMQEMADENK